MRRPAIRGLALALVVPGCASGSVFGPEPPNPARIVLRNATGRDLAEVVLRGVTGGEVERFGAVSPLAAGREVTFARPDPPPPVAEHVEVRWRERGGAPQSRTLALRKGLEALAGRPETTLVLTIERSGNVGITLAK